MSRPRTGLRPVRLQFRSAELQLAHLQAGDRRRNGWRGVRAPGSDGGGTVFSRSVDRRQATKPDERARCERTNHQMHAEPGGTPPPPERSAGHDTGGAPLVFFDAPVPTRWTSRASGPGSWDDVIRDSIRYEYERQQIRSSFVEQIRGWRPGTVVDLADLADVPARSLLRRFLALAGRNAVEPTQICFKSNGLVTPTRPANTARKARCWPLMAEFSWALLLPNGRLALQVPPDEFAAIVTADASTSLTVAGINAPTPYGLAADTVAESIVSWCRAHRLRW